MSHELPILPSADHLRYQASNLFDLCRVGDSGAIALLCEVFPEFRTKHIVEFAASVRLHHDAQDAIAAHYGFHRWSQLCESVELSCRAASALSVAMENPRMEDLDYRAGIARGKRLPEIGTSRLSRHGVRYDVVDYAPAISPVTAARLRSGDAHAHINDLLPVISFPEMSDRLYELYIETDTVTNRPILFFDTMPGLHPKMAVKGMHQVTFPALGDKLYVLFDAAELHETLVAHELGHIWVERVEQKEDYRHPKDQSNLPRATQFYHVQSFVMDLCVNDLLIRRGFDMSVIAADQAQTIVNYAENVAKRRPMRGKRVLAGVINTLAGALLEMERFPGGWAGRIRTALDMIEIGLPEAFEPARGFVESVLKHGYEDSHLLLPARALIRIATWN